VCIEILLFTKFRQQNTNLVRDVADCFVCGGFAPVGQLTCDGETLFASSFVALNEVVLGFDELVELLAQLWLDCAAERAEAEAMTSGRGGAGVLVRTDGECAVPVEDRTSATGRMQAMGRGNVSTNV
jgi:hypothetical protein